MRATVFAYPATLTRDAKGRFLVRFRDFPEALTDGASEAEALREAADALSEALMSRIVDGEAIPDPSPAGRKAYQVAPDATVALKAALHKIVREKGVTAADLSRLLAIDHKEARRLLGAREHSKVPRLTQALEALGYSVTTAVYDASKRERILSSPVAPRMSRIPLTRAVHVGGAQYEEQRRSFVYGNTKIENDRVTREMVDEQAEIMRRRRREGRSR